MKHYKLLLAALLLALSLLGCSGEEAGEISAAPDATATSEIDLLTAPWTEVEAAARGGVVRFYMYGGFAHTNRWVDTWVAAEMQARYGVTVVREPMDASVFVNKLLTEKQAGREEGSIDLLWVNGENFKNLKEADALFGPYAERCPNFHKHVDAKLAGSDFGYPVHGFETPYGQAQFVYEYDTARADSSASGPPADFPGLLEWAKANPGKFTYPQPPDFTGSAFIRQAFYALTGGHEQYMHGFDQDLFDANAPRLWAWLNELKPYLWQEGRAYPKGSANLDTLFARGEVDLCMSYHPLHAQSKILEGTYPSTVKSFVFADGSIFNLHFTAIPFNAPNKAAAMVLANFLMSPEAQLSKLEPVHWGDFPAINLDTLDSVQQGRFQAVDLGAATLSAAELVKAAVPEVPSAYVEALERGWEEHVLHGE